METIAIDSKSVGFGMLRGPMSKFIHPATQAQVLDLLSEVAFAIQCVHQENDEVRASGSDEHTFIMESYHEQVSAFSKFRTARVALPGGGWVQISLDEPHRKEIRDERTLCQAV